MQLRQDPLSGLNPDSSKRIMSPSVYATKQVPQLHARHPDSKGISLAYANSNMVSNSGFQVNVRLDFENRIFI